jgi:hypothetical protein
VRYIFHPNYFLIDLKNTYSITVTLFSISV